MGERSETLMRIVVVIITGIILSVWKILIEVFFVINFIVTLISGKRMKELASMSETWNTQWYVFQRYIIFLTNERPFPFTPLARNMSNFKR